MLASSSPCFERDFYSQLFEVYHSTDFDHCIAAGDFNASLGELSSYEGEFREVFSGVVPQSSIQPTRDDDGLELATFMSELDLALAYANNEGKAINTYRAPSGYGGAVLDLFFRSRSTGSFSFGDEVTFTLTPESGHGIISIKFSIEASVPAPSNHEFVSNRRRVDFELKKPSLANLWSS